MSKSIKNQHRTTRLLGSYVALGASLAMVFAGAVSANAAEGTVIYRGSQTNDKFITSAGIDGSTVEHTAYFELRDGSEKSNNLAKTSADNNASIFDLDKDDATSSLNAVYHMKNTGSSATTVNTVLLLPYNYGGYEGNNPNKPDLYVDTAQLEKDHPTWLVSGMTDLSLPTVNYTTVGGPAAQSSWDAVVTAEGSGTTAWKNMRNLQFIGKLQPGESFDIKIPLKLDKPGQIVDGASENLEAEIGEWFFTTGYGLETYDGYLLMSRLKRDTNANGDKVAMATTNLPYFGSTGPYENLTAVPAYIQKLIPNIAANGEFSGANFWGTDMAKFFSDYTKLYQGASYRVQFDPIKKALQNVGWSVRSQAEEQFSCADTVDMTKLCDNYVFGSQDWANSVGGEGSEIAGPGEGIELPDSPKVSRVYLRLVEVIKTADATRNVDEAWSPLDSLPQLAKIDGTFYKTGDDAGTLTQNADGTWSYANIPGLTITIDAALVSNGDGTFTTPKAGSYSVTFAYDQQHDNGTAQAESLDDVTKSATVTFKAVSAALHFDGNTAESGTVADITGNKHDDVNVPENAFIHDGYKFTGWNTATDGTGVSYAPGDEFEISGDVTLYAQWEKVSAPVEPPTPSPTTPAPTAPATPPTVNKPPTLATTGAAATLPLALAISAVLTGALLLITRKMTSRSL